jgi:hypothetical protein
MNDISKYSPEVLKNMGEWVQSQNHLLEKEMLEAKAKEMQTEIDREVLWGMLEGMGWSRVMLSKLVDNMHAIDISYWLDANCKNSFERNGRDFIFEDSKDANWFKLRWGSV